MVKGKNIVITGCLQGIGKETLKVFAENGANVIACAHRQDDTFSQFCRELEEKNKVSVMPIYFDMMDNAAYTLFPRVMGAAFTLPRQ